MSGLHLPTFSGSGFIVSLSSSVLFRLLIFFLGDSQDKVNQEFKQLEDHQQRAAEIQTQSSSQGRDQTLKLK